MATKRKIRKDALRWAAALIVGQDLENQVEALPPDDGNRFRSAVEHIARHLEWEADGRPEK